jgi:hypothetical protein
LSRRLLSSQSLTSCSTTPRSRIIIVHVSSTSLAGDVQYMCVRVHQKVKFVPLVLLFSGISILKVFVEMVQSIIQCHLMSDTKEHV